MLSSKKGVKLLKPLFKDFSEQMLKASDDIFKQQFQDLSELSEKN